MMQTCVKEQGLKQACTMKPRVSYTHGQVVFLDYFSLDLDIYNRKNNVGNHFLILTLFEKVVLHLFLSIFEKSCIIKTAQYVN